MAKNPTSTSALDFAFFNFLWSFYDINRGAIRQNYRDLTKKYLDYNDKSKRQEAFLRRPQFEALEVYVFLKEFLDNDKVEKIFEDWYKSQNKFENRKATGFLKNESQGSLLFDDAIELDNYKNVLQKMKDNSREYPNYIFALTMGTGKTLLMATCIYYEFLLANKFPKDSKYCQNALIFAPDKTVLQSLREIESFNLTKVVPLGYENFLNTNIKFHFLEEAGTNLSTIDNSTFNIIITNTQKVILKRSHAKKSASVRLFEQDKVDFGEFSDLYGDLGIPTSESELTSNQRFEKLSRLPRLGVYVDEAHHSFGTALKKNMMGTNSKTDNSLRTTIDELASNLEAVGTKVVGCYNYTGTPYIGKDVLPEVVYAFNLGDAIREKYLKWPDLSKKSSNTKDSDFISMTIKDFLKKTDGLRPEGMLPKLAFFATSIDELVNELKPEIEKQLIKYNIPLDRILVNVGDEKLTSSDDIREFNRLDTPQSNKQFILLVNKGREGWNCRSLFGVAMYRSPKSKVFVLQATMRCLRSIGEKQHVGSIFLSEENYEILDRELQSNFRMTASEFNENPQNDKPKLKVKVREHVQISLKIAKHTVVLKNKDFIKGTSLGLESEDNNAWHELTKKYHVIETRTTLEENATSYDRDERTNDRTSEKEKRAYSKLTLVAEIATYLNISPLKIEKLLSDTQEGVDIILKCVNDFNELLHDVVIPNLFKETHEIETETETFPRIVNLIVPPGLGEQSFYEVHEGKGGTAYYDVASETYRDKSFNLDTYTFDSNPERTLFWDLLKDEDVEKVYFTGMFTNKSKTDFYFQYIDPDSYVLRDYYPDFLVKLKNGGYIIIEVKGDDKFYDPTVLAKQKATQEYALHSQIEYRMIKGTDALAHLYRFVLNGDSPVSQLSYH